MNLHLTLFVETTSVSFLAVDATVLMVNVGRRSSDVINYINRSVIYRCRGRTLG